MIELQRVDNWRGRFEQTIDEIRYRPFAWDAECAIHLCGRLVQAVTDIDVAAPYRGRFSTAAGAVRVMTNSGFSNLADLVASILPEIHPSQMEIGDVAAIADDSKFGFALGVCNGERIFVIKESGLGTVDMLDAKRAFKVG
ncbi:DUF6950 family protein [Ensifer canadensis]